MEGAEGDLVPTLEGQLPPPLVGIVPLALLRSSHVTLRELECTLYTPHKILSCRRKCRLTTQSACQRVARVATAVQQKGCCACRRMRAVIISKSIIGISSFHLG